MFSICFRWILHFVQSQITFPAGYNPTFYIDNDSDCWIIRIIPFSLSEIILYIRFGRRRYRCLIFLLRSGLEKSEFIAFCPLHLPLPKSHVPVSFLGDTGTMCNGTHSRSSRTPALLYPAVSKFILQRLHDSVIKLLRSWPA